MAASHDVFRAIAASVLATAALAQPGDCGAAGRPGIEVGVRANALSADPDLYGFGIAARFPVRDRWFVDATLERRFYDTRVDGELAGADLQSLVAGVALGRHYPDSAMADWFWTWGIAAGLPDVGTALPGSGVAQIASVEIHLTASLGIRRRLSERWSLTGAVKVERHYLDWRTTDRDGRILREKLSLTPAGLYLALNYRF